MLHRTERIKNSIRDTMQFSPDKESFVKTLKDMGITVLFRENGSGRLYGMTFIDHKEKVVLNGSRLGKVFSANIFHNYFNENGVNPFLNSYSDKKTFNGHFNTAKTIIKDNEEQTLLETLLLEESDLLDVLPSYGIDYKELAFIKKMRRLYSGKRRGRKQ